MKTEKLDRGAIIREYDTISLSVIFHRYHYHISKNPISHCEQMRKKSIRKAPVILSIS